MFSFLEEIPNQPLPARFVLPEVCFFSKQHDDLGYLDVTIRFFFNLLKILIIFQCIISFKGIEVITPGKTRIDCIIPW